MRSFVDTLALNPWRWLVVTGIASAAAALIGAWSAAVIMFVVVMVAVSTAARVTR